MPERDRIGSSPVGGGTQHFWMKTGELQLPRIQRGKGIYVWDTEGKRYIDASSGPVVCNLGHGNKYVLEAMARQASQVTYAYPTSFESEANTKLANLLCEMAGPGLERAFFVSGGSEAVEMCLKFARHHAIATGFPQRTQIISRKPSYHGNTFGALAVNGEQHAEEMFSGMLRAMPKIPLPMTYRTPDGETTERYVERCAQALEDEILRQGADSVLAFIIEPIAGVAGGASYAPDWYYQRIREICNHYGVLLIFDEVMSGAGRTGKFLTAHYWPNAGPDIIAMAKGFSGGYFPLGAMLVGNRLLTPVIEAGGFHMGHTYKSNPLGCAVGKAVLEQLVDLNLVENAAEMGRYLREQLVALKSGFAIIGDVRGLGLLNAIEFVADPISKSEFPEKTDIVTRFVRICRDRGLLIYARKNAGSGAGDWVMITPPLIINEAQIDEIIALLASSLGQLGRDLANDR